MIKNILFFIAISSFFIQAQVIPIERTVNWTQSGLKDTTTNNFNEIDVADWGLIGDSLTPNDSTFNILLDSIQGGKSIINFGQGAFLFTKTIHLKSNTIIRGQGINDTKLIMDLGGSGHAISINGTIVNQIKTGITQTALNTENSINVIDTSGFQEGDWIKIGKKDDTLVTSNWALNTVGQIVQIDRILNHKFILSSALRLDYTLTDSVYIIKMNPVKNVGIECLNIIRVDETPTQQSSNIRMNYAVNCWVNGIESYKCTFSHIEARNSSNIYVGNSYLRHAHNYGGGGRGYGVMLHLTTNECLIENNIFERLRHSMIVQAGANANVFTFNYSFDPHRVEQPSNSSGDIVLHGNYVYANLFEQNICRNIIIDNSHGPNGPYNTFFRNRAEGYGIYFTTSNSPYQNIVANEVNEDTIPFVIIGYIVQGNNQFEFGNIVYDSIVPKTSSLINTPSYAYHSKPDFVPALQWAKIGSQENINLHKIPAYDYYKENKFYGDNCDYPLVNPSTVTTKINDRNNGNVLIYPNPSENYFKIKSDFFIKSIKIFNNLGQSVLKIDSPILKKDYQIEIKDWNKGVYYLNIQTEKETFYHQLITK